MQYTEAATERCSLKIAVLKFKKLNDYCNFSKILENSCKGINFK